MLSNDTLLTPRERSAAAVDVTVVIPSSERTQMALWTVQSVLKQSTPVREVIIVTNGDDQHAKFWEGHAGGQVKVVREQLRGQQAARNAGIRAASCSWVATLDDDDIYEPEFIASVMPAIADGRADIISTDHRKFRPERVDRKTNFQAAPKRYWEGIQPAGESLDWSFIGKFPLDRLLRRIPIYPSTTVIRRDFALAIGGYDRRMRGIASEDIEFLVRALTYGDVSLVWRPMVRYRVHSGNCSKDAATRAVGRWRVFEFVRENHPQLPKSFKKALDLDLPRRRRSIVRLAYGLGDFGLMEEAWSKLAAHQYTPDVLALRLLRKYA